MMLSKFENFIIFNEILYFEATLGAYRLSFEQHMHFSMCKHKKKLKQIFSAKTEGI